MQLTPPVRDPCQRKALGAGHPGGVGSGNDANWHLETPGRAYEGVREAVGTSSSQTSCYVLFRVDERSRIMEAIPLAEWASYRPAISYETFTSEQAEQALSSNDHQGAKSDARMSKFLRHGDADDAEGGAAFGGGEDGFEEEGGEEGGGAGMWDDEDGREGLDMEEEDLFDDDEDDHGFEDDEEAVSARNEGKNWASSGSVRGVGVRA